MPMLQGFGDMYILIVVYEHKQSGSIKRERSYECINPVVNIVLLKP